MAALTPISSAKRTRVLLVDDEEAFANVTRQQLERTGKYDVRCLYCGRDVVRTATDWQPDIVLLDYMLPDLDGGQVFQKLKNDPSLDRIPIILLTGLAKEDTPFESGVRPGRLTLSKPVDFEKLEEAIHLLTTRHPPRAHLPGSVAVAAASLSPSWRSRWCPRRAPTTRIRPRLHLRRWRSATTRC